ncbi:MAG: hypothetical protein MUE41_00665 [Gemmatimonadaceae bacterium]|jgi:hypothetical protein|nr:hypothetical protein [Gemmatimonadaceae bacterium]
MHRSTLFLCAGATCGALAALALVHPPTQPARAQRAARTLAMSVGSDTSPVPHRVRDVDLLQAIAFGTGAAAARVAFPHPAPALDARLAPLHRPLVDALVREDPAFVRTMLAASTSGDPHRVADAHRSMTLRLHALLRARPELTRAAERLARSTHLRRRTAAALVDGTAPNGTDASWNAVAFLLRHDVATRGDGSNASGIVTITAVNPPTIGPLHAGGHPAVGCLLGPCGDGAVAAASRDRLRYDQWVALASTVFDATGARGGVGGE